MSLHTLANHLQSAGRGQDKVLVHMTPGEVQGLQSLAMAHGGSLTINPETGLPEAGILSAILPMVAGFFLGPAGIGLTAMQSAVAVGALGTAATGSLGKGFMMGLGAYGGAGLGEGLANVGGSTMSNVPGEFGVNAGTGTGADYAKWMGETGQTQASADMVAQNAAKNAAEEAAFKTVNPYTGGLNAYSAPQPFVNPEAMAQNPLGLSQQTLPNAAETMRTGLATTPTPPSSGDLLQEKLFGDVTPKATTYTAPEPQALTYDQATPTWDASKPATTPSNWDKMSAGAKRGLGSWEGAKEVWNATPTGTGYGLAATGMSVMQAQQEEAAAEAKAKADAMAAARRGYYRPYDFTTNLADNAFAPRESSAEFKYYDEPRFVARPIEKIAKEGGLMSLAVGGPVEEMAARNAVGSNTMYPQAQLKTDMYSNPMVQRPMPNDVITAGVDAPTGRYTGEAKFGSGGAATVAKAEPTTSSKYSYDPATMSYTQTTTNTPATQNNRAAMLGLPAGIGTSAGMALGRQQMLGGYIPWFPDAHTGKQQAAQQPTITTQTMGGVAAPYMPPSGLAAADTSMVPNIQLQPQQNVDRQLGLEAFYPMMEQQLALKGSNLQARGYADGGVARFGGGGTMAQPTAEGTARQKYARENKPGIIPSVSDEEWNNYKKLQNLSFTSAASSAAPAYKYNPATMQYTDNAGKVTGGMEQSFIPVIMPQQLTPEEQMGLGGYQGYAEGGTANGGYSLGSYSDGGRLLRGPGDGVSDSIPASIGAGQPARLADGEFVVPARIVSEIGNGSTEAGARKLYAMMDRVQKARRKTVGKGKVAVNTKADKLLPA